MPGLGCAFLREFALSSRFSGSIRWRGPELFFDSFKPQDHPSRASLPLAGVKLCKLFTGNTYLGAG